MNLNLSIIASKHGTTIFFSHCNLFVGKLKEKLARKACINTSEYIGLFSCPLGIVIQNGHYISKKVYWLIHKYLALHGNLFSISSHTWQLTTETVSILFSFCFFGRRNNFNLSLNGQDILDNDSVPLKDLGIVKGDLIYVIPARDSEQHGDNPGNQYADFPALQHPFQHSPERSNSLQVINMMNHDTILKYGF